MSITSFSLHFWSFDIIFLVFLVHLSEYCTLHMKNMEALGKANFSQTGFNFPVADIQHRGGPLTSPGLSYCWLFLACKAQASLGNWVFAKAHLSCQALNFSSSLSIVKLPKSLSFLASYQTLSARLLGMQLICNDLASYWRGNCVLNFSAFSFTLKF